MYQAIYQVATWLVPLIIAIVFHEVAHGWVAKYFGDRTASRMGRLTLNPIKHVDPIGTVALPMMLAVSGAPIFGWAKPVPVDQRGLRNPRWNMVAVALAGPGMNMLLALLTLGAMVLMLATTGIGTPVTQFVWANLSNFIIINIMLAVFNMLPLPPFDGSHVMEGILPRPLARRYARLRPYGMALMLILFVALPLIAPNQNLVGKLIGPPVEGILALLSQILAYFAR